MSPGKYTLAPAHSVLY
jgi:ribonuclease HII